MSKRLGGIIGLFVQGWLSPRTRATSYPKQVFESGRESFVDAPPLEYNIILIWISALKKIVDFVSMSAMCHVKNDFLPRKEYCVNFAADACSTVQ